jgi:hypothetical protein
MIPTHTPTLDTGLVGAWHISGALCVRADLALSEPGHLGGVEWLEEVSEARWAVLFSILWRPGPRGPVRRPTERVRGYWKPLGHLLAASVGDRVVCLPKWARPVLVSPVNVPRLCRLVTMPDGAEVVVVSEGGEVVAFVPVVRT